MLRTFVVSLVLLVCTSVAAAPRWHFSMVRSVPTKDQTLAVAPTRLQIWFSEAPAAGVSRITLHRDADVIALKGTVVVAAEKSMHADPVKALDTGTYTLNWRAAGDDGHVMTGELKFTIAPKLQP